MCSSQQIGVAAPAGVGSPVQVVPPTPPTNPPVNPPSGTNVETNIGGTYTGPGPGGVGWMDSFQHNGVCYIDSNFDHGIGSVSVDTPQGPKTVQQVAQAQNAPSRVAGDPIYNDVQCGNGPPNNAGDEDLDQCPGRVDQGKAGCRKIGPKWNLSQLFPGTPGGGVNDGVAQAESVSVRGGWVTTPIGITWQGDNRYSIGQRQDSANMSYTFNVPESGTYRFGLRGRIDHSAQTEPPNDVWFTFGNRDWTKAYIAQNTQGWSTSLIGEFAGSHSTTLLESQLPVGNVEVVISGRSRGFEIDYITLTRVAEVPDPPPPVAGNFGHYLDGDLLAVHWDSAFDYDDLQSMIATREVLDEYPTVDFTVVNGARKRNLSGVLPGSTELMLSLFPSGLDANADLNGVVQVTATTWQLTLANGNQVHVAEGGPSDFTADVVRELQSRGVTNLRDIHIVQHSHGWNEDNTIPANITYLEQMTHYVRIHNGNSGNNDTPDYNLQGGGFESRARASRYGQEWAIAFSAVTDPNRVVDFSDTVEVLYILGIAQGPAATPSKFADIYF